MDDDASYQGAGGMMTSGKHRFDTLIKTMIARIEYNNTLAPVQEYGRHQLQANKKKKKGKGATQGDENSKAMEENEDGDKSQKLGKGNSHYDDRYYDLDDGFIDDGDLEDSCYNNGMMGMGNNGFGDEFDGYHDNDDDIVSSSGLTYPGQQSVQQQINVEYDPDASQKLEDEKE